MSRIPMLLALLALLLATATSAEPLCVDYDDTMHWLPHGDPDDFWAYGMIVDGGYAFVEGLHVFDLADPSAPEIVAGLPVIGSPVEKIGDLLICAGSYLHLVDVSDPLAPVLLGSSAEGVSEVAVDGDIVVATYRSLFDDKLRVFDISDPSAPTMIADLFVTNNTSSQIAYANDVAFIRYEGAGSRIVPFDLSDPTNPIPLPAHPDGDPRIYHMKARGDRLYTYGNWEAGNSMLQILDSTDPLNLPVVGSLELSGPGSVLKPWGDTLLMSGGGGFQIVDISDETDPTLVGGLSNCFGTTDAGMHDGHVFVVGTGNGFDGGYQPAWIRVADVSSGQAAASIGNLSSLFGNDFALDGDLVHVVGSDGYRIVDVADPTAPALVADLPLSATATEVTLAGSHAYVLLRHADCELVCIDVSKVDAPVQVGSLGLPCESADDLVHRAGRVYIAGTENSPFDWSPSLTVVDVHDPADPQLVTFFDTDTYGLSRSLLLTADGLHMIQATSTSLITLFLAIPENPQVVAEYSPPAQLTSAVCHDELLVTCSSASSWGMGDGIFDFYDVSDPSQITQHSSLRLSDTARGMLIGGGVPPGVAYLSCGDGLRSISIEDLSAPFELGNYGISAGMMLDAGDFIVGLAGAGLGLATLPYDCTNTAVTPTPTPREPALAAWPNPFNPETTLHFRLGAAGPVHLAVYDVAGRRVCTLLSGDRAAGELRVSWDGRDDTGSALPSGVYLARIETPEAIGHAKLILLK